MLPEGAGANPNGKLVSREAANRGKVQAIHARIAPANAPVGAAAEPLAI
jgi:hypothetical protein